MKKIIEIKGLDKYYGDYHALTNLSLDVMDGEFLTLLGPSGCGKTTLLRLLSGLDTPDKGTITLRGEDITHQPPEKRNGVNMVFQNYALFPHMNVYDNVAFGLRCHAVPEDQVEKRVNALLAKVRLSEQAYRKPSELSGGQQQRVAIARAAVNEPHVLLLDEPLSALDKSLRKNMQLELKNLQRDLGITFILVTHDQEEALSMSDRIVVMNHGIIEQIGTPRDVYEEPCSLYVAEFVGEANIFATEIMEASDNSLSYKINNILFISKNRKQLGKGELVNIVIRPEDIHVIQKSDDYEGSLIPGIVESVIYKGCTVDLIVRLTTNGQRIYATEFFNEDDEELIYAVGESVGVGWYAGWEVMVPHENV